MLPIFGSGILTYVIISMQFQAVAHLENSQSPLFKMFPHVQKPNPLFLTQSLQSKVDGDSAVVPGIPTSVRNKEKISLLRRTSNSENLLVRQSQHLSKQFQRNVANRAWEQKRRKLTKLIKLFIWRKRPAAGQSVTADCAHPALGFAEQDARVAACAAVQRASAGWQAAGQTPPQLVRGG